MVIGPLHVCNHVGVQLQVSNLNFLLLDTHRIRTPLMHALMALIDFFRRIT